MSTTMVASEAKAVPPVVSSIQQIPLGNIRESKTNPRGYFDQAKLAELAENIRQHGILQLILVRPLPEGAADTYELVAGARRYRASKLAGRESIPATVRELTDTQCLEMQLIENLQRAEVHELDEGRVTLRSCNSNRKPTPWRLSLQRWANRRPMCMRYVLKNINHIMLRS